MALLCACDAPRGSEEASPAAVQSGGNCRTGSAFSAELYGSIERRLDWAADEMVCESMLRPDGEGARLRFTGPAADRQLSVILALPGLERGATGDELATVVTLTVEGSGRFFSTANLDTCWTDVSAQEPLADDDYEIAGKVYCVAPLGEVNGEAAITVAELSFRGTLAWE